MYHRKIKSRLPIRSVTVVDETTLRRSQIKISHAAPTKSNVAAAPVITEPPPALLEELIESIQELEQRRAQSIDELREAATEIGLLVASRVAYEKINAGDYEVDALVNAALEHVDAMAPITIQLNPNDLERLFELFDEKQTAELMPAVTFNANAALKRGECQVDTPDFGLITTVEQRLADIRDLLFEGLHDAWTTRRKPGTDAQQLRRFPDRRKNA